MRGLYVTADLIGPTGGGQVIQHEVTALGKACGEADGLTGKALVPGPYVGIDIPYLADYFALAQVSREPAGKYARVHFYSGSFSATVREFASRGIPVTYTCPAHDRAVSREEFARWGQNYPYPHLTDEGLWQQTLRGYQMADLVIAPSNLSAEFLAANGCKDIIVIPHGCDLPEKHWGFPSEFRVGYLGATGPDKGLPYLIAAWGKLAYKDATLVLAGAGTENLGPMIRQIAPAGRFHLMGYVENKEDFYKEVQVYVQPSCCESFGIEIIEAMARGRYVIASDGAGASEITGVHVVPKRNPDAIAEQIEKLRGYSEEDEFGPMLVGRDYTWERIEERYVEVFSRHWSRTPLFKPPGHVRLQSVLLGTGSPLPRVISSDLVGGLSQ